MDSTGRRMNRKESRKKDGTGYTCMKMVPALPCCSHENYPLTKPVRILRQKLNAYLLTHVRVESVDRFYTDYDQESTS